MQNNNIKSKIDPIILHTIPFLPSRTRKENYQIKREWGDRTLTLRAKETLNTYDFITLLQLLKDYVQKQSEWEKVGETLEKGKFILRKKIDISALARERGVLNKTANKKTILKSILRLAGIDVNMTNKKTGDENNTKYIYETKYKGDNQISEYDYYKNNGISSTPQETADYKEIEVLANQLFFDFCINNGLVINLDNILKYSKENTVLLDVFIQSTNWDKYNEELLFERCGLNETAMSEKEKRRLLKKSFTEFNKFNENKFTLTETRWEKKGNDNTPKGNDNTPTRPEHLGT